MDPRKKCAVSPKRHARDMFLARGLSQYDLERMVREGQWIPEGGVHYDVVYRSWHLKVMLLRCLIRVKTAFED